MLFFLLPFAVLVGVLATSARSRAATVSAGGGVMPRVVQQHALAAPAAQQQARLPSPLEAMNGFLARGERVPAFVAQCAIAEATLQGNHELANQIAVQLQPHVQPQANAQQSQQSQPQRSGGGLENAAIPYENADGGDDRANRDPFVETPRFSEYAPMQQAQAQQVQQAPRQQPMVFVPPAPFGAYDDASMPAPNQGHGSYEADGIALPVPSPIRGIDGEAWQAFAQRCAREAPTFATDKHVGQYRQSKARLRELGIDPVSLVGDPARQDDALAVEAIDALKHLDASGTLAAYVGQPISIPGGGETTVTLSGVLGVASSAGLEGTVSWLEKDRDRRRYPHTTQAFLLTNGAF